MKQRAGIVIEDDIALGDITAEILRSLGFETELITDGALALAGIASKRPDIVLLDLHLPNKSGIEILDELRADPQIANVKVIVVTADVRSAERMRKKADGILIKPYMVDDFLSLLTALDMAAE